MELTFLKLVGSHTTGGRERERRGRRSGQEKRRSKKDRSAGASWVDGDNGSLGIALSIFGPLGPSASPHPTGTTLDSIPFHSTPFPPPWTTLETLAVPYPSSRTRENPPVKHGASQATLPRKPCPHFLGAWRSIPLDVYAWYPPFQTTTFPDSPQWTFVLHFV